MRGAAVVGVVWKSAFWVRQRLGLRFSFLDLVPLPVICGGVDRFEAAFFLARRRVVGFPSLPPVKLDLGPVGLRRRARRGERYCVVAVALALARAAASVCLSVWPSMTSQGLFRRRSGFVIPGSPLLVLLCPSAYGGNMELSSVLDASTSRGSWIFGFPVPRRSLVFRLVIPAPLLLHLGSQECVAAESSWRSGSSSIGGGS
ncbi:hypothetical protein YC2023_012936 [Brassica napus]